jgi:hypothetical protein
MVKVWNLATGLVIAAWTGEPGSDVQACCTVPTDASLIVYGDSTGGVHLLRLLE